MFLELCGTKNFQNLFLKIEMDKRNWNIKIIEGHNQLWNFH